MDWILSLVAPDVARMAQRAIAESKDCPVTFGELETDGMTAAWRAVQRGDRRRPCRRTGKPNRNTTARLRAIALSAARWAMVERRQFALGGLRGAERKINRPMAFDLVSYAMESESDPEREAISRTFAAWALRRMTPREAGFVRLYFWGDRNCDEIADLFCINRRDVQRTLHQGLARAAVDAGADVARTALDYDVRQRLVLSGQERRIRRAVRDSKSVVEAALRLGVHPTTLWRWRTGKTKNPRRAKRETLGDGARARDDRVAVDGGNDLRDRSDDGQRNERMSARGADPEVGSGFDPHMARTGARGDRVA